MDLRSYTGHHCRPSPTGSSRRGICQSRKSLPRTGLRWTRHRRHTWSCTHSWTRRRRLAEETGRPAKINLGQEDGGPCRKTSGVNEWRRVGDSLILFLLNEGRAERERDYCRMYVTSMPKGAKRECKRSGTVSNMNLKPNHCTAAFPPRLPIGWQGRASRGQSPTSSIKYALLTQHLRLHQYEPFIARPPCERLRQSWSTVFFIRTMVAHLGNLSG